MRPNTLAKPCSSHFRKFDHYPHHFTLQKTRSCQQFGQKQSKSPISRQLPMCGHSFQSHGKRGCFEPDRRGKLIKTRAFRPIRAWITICARLVGKNLPKLALPFAALILMHFAGNVAGMGFPELCHLHSMCRSHGSSKSNSLAVHSLEVRLLIYSWSNVMQAFYC